MKHLLPILSCEQSKQLDKKTIGNIGMPELSLMEEAAERCFQALLNDFPLIKDYRVAVVVGTGNNAADALCIARKLYLGKIKTEVLLCKNTHGTESYNTHFNTTKNFGISIKQAIESNFAKYDLIVDGIFGIGYTIRSTLTENDRNILSIIERINESNTKVVSIDIPSGISDDTSTNNAIIANKTYSIGYPKRPFYTIASRKFCGIIINIPISFESITGSDTNICITHDKPKCKLSMFTHKYNRGSVLVVGGNTGTLGAPTFASRAIMASGAGIVFSLTQNDCLKELSTISQEMVHDSIDNIENYISKCQVSLIGPGIGFHESNKSKNISDITIFIEHFNGRIIFDASFFSFFSPAILSQAKHPPILTPHTGELRRFFPKDTENLDTNTIETVRAIATKYNVFLILKDVSIYFATPEGEVTIFDHPNRIASQAGSGDILAGYLAGTMSVYNGCDISDIVGYSITRFYDALESMKCYNSYPTDKLIEKLRGIDE